MWVVYNVYGNRMVQFIFWWNVFLNWFYSHIFWTSWNRSHIPAELKPVFFFFFLFCFYFLTYLFSSFPTSLPSNRSFVTQNVFYKPVVLASPGVILKMLNPGSIKELLNQSLHIKIIPDKNCWNGYQCSTTICCLQFCYCHLPGILVISGTCGKIRPITKKKYRDKSRGFV